MADNSKPNSLQASMAKAKAGRTCVDVALSCVELCGSVGYDEGSLLEKWARDAKILDIFEGTQQIQLLIVARAARQDLRGIALATDWRPGAPLAPRIAPVRQQTIDPRPPPGNVWSPARVFAFTADHAPQLPAHVRIPDDRRACQRQGTLNLHGARHHLDHLGPLRPPDARHEGEAAGMLDAYMARAETAVRLARPHIAS